jgi:predicted MPP superfamily phosphohydrolase
MKLLIASLLSIVILFNMAEKSDLNINQPNYQDQKPLFTFGILADVQYSDDEPAGTRFYRSSLGKLREAVTAFKKDSAEFIINLGDLIDKKYKSYLPVLDIIDSSGIKTFHVTGNHDYSVDPDYKKKLPVLSSHRRGYYDMVVLNFRFLFLNGNEISTYGSDKKNKIEQAASNLMVMKESGEINAVDWNGGFSNKQLEWIEKELSKAANANQKVFLVCHFPVFPENVHNLLNYKEVLPVLGKYKNIIAWLNGHNHAGNYGNLNNVHFVTFKGMVETDSNNSFALVDVYSNRIVIRGFGREESQVLSY